MKLFFSIEVPLKLKKVANSLLKPSKAALNGKIFVAYHRPFWEYQSEIFQPIQAGRAIAKTSLNMIGDDSGDHISEKNPIYSELTVHYWAWKNLPAVDFIGFMHYRRYLNFAETKIKSSQRYERLVDGSVSSKLFIDEDAVNELMHEYDILLPVKTSYEVFTVAEQYWLSHSKKDWDILVSLIVKNHPEYIPFVEKIFYNSTSAYIANCFVMRYPLFQEYMDWLFPILEEFEKKVEISSDPYQKRVTGYVSERLLNLFVARKLQEGLKVKELDWIYIDDSDDSEVATSC